ncbi:MULTISPECIES: gamma carbonic anhydrase family protein [unclassified Frankia]|uniref:gamma carbonic anhydrase family protein n=1 Tax=unclassified Frankia TaxID=2632575 RepID=UPI0020256093
MSVAVYALGDRVPEIDPSAYVHPDATVIGKVTIGPESTIWPGAVLRADYGEIHIGARTSVQDGTVVHATAELPTIIGDDCVIGHIAHLEGCTVEDGSLVGSGSIVLHRAVVGRGALVGAQALVGNNVRVPPRALAVGVPAKIRPDAVAENAFAAGAAMYTANGKRYREELRRLD